MEGECDLITRINDRMNEWALWVGRREGDGLGFPRECPYTRLVASYGKIFQAEMNERAWEIDQAIRAGGEADMCFAKVFYLAPGTAEQKAKELAVSPRRLFELLDRLHNRILGWLNGYYARGEMMRERNRLSCAHSYDINPVHMESCV